MNENLNLVEILKNCTEGTKLYSPIIGEVEFKSIKYCEYQIVTRCKNWNRTLSFTKEGLFFQEGVQGECIMLFPSKDQRDWSKFKIKKPKFDQKTFQPFDKVLIKMGTESYHLWFPDFISLPPNDVDEKILCMNTDDVVMVIPYNEETKNLVDTNDEAPEFYRYWED